MPWNRTTRKLYSHSNDRRQNDLTDDERTIVRPMPSKRGKMGRPRRTGLRSVFDGGRYILSTGRRWRALPTGIHRPEPFPRLAPERSTGHVPTPCGTPPDSARGVRRSRPPPPSTAGR